MPRLREKRKPSASPGGSRLRTLALRAWRWLWTETSNRSEEIPPSDVSELEPAASGQRPSKLRYSSTKETLRDFSDLGPLKIITWLGASAGGLTILLIMIGFLSLSAHDAMLGIPRSIQNNPEYVAVGGLFFGRSIIFMVVALISLKSWIVLGALLFGAVVLFNIPQRPSYGKSLVIGLFSVVLLAAEVYGLERLIRPLQISNLLLGPSVDFNSPGKQTVDAILVKDTSWLGVEYGFLALFVLALSIAFILLEQHSRGGIVLSGREHRITLWRLVRVPAFALLVICIFLLPRAYGVLTISNNYPEVNFDDSSPSDSGALSSVRFLLREDDKVFILYDPSSQSIVTIKRESITQHRVYAPQHIFTASIGKE